MTNLYAKDSGESLREHTLKVLEGVKRLKETISPYLSRIGDDFWRYLENAAFIHDFGKATGNFQAYIRQFIKDEKIEKRVGIDELVPHSIYSLVLSNWYEWEMEDRWRQIILSSVYFHHERSKLYLTRIDGKIEPLTAAELEALKNEFAGIDPAYVGLMAAELKSINYRYVSFLKAPGIVITDPSPGSVTGEEKEFQEKYVYIKGFLHRADHYASSLEKGDTDVSRIEISPIPVDIVEENTRAGITRRAAIPGEPWQFTEIGKRGIRGKNTILIGATGIGKTEFAFLWGAGRKMFYTLPMRTMTNEIFKRARGIFGEEVGLLHSTAAAVLSRIMERHEEWETSDLLQFINLSRNLAFPVIVCTGDQILNVSLKYPTYEKIMASLGCSNLVIDEIQAYSPETSAIIVKTIEETVKMGGHFLLITATLPGYIEEEIKKRTGPETSNIFHIYSKKGAEDIKRHKLHLIPVQTGNKKEKPGQGEPGGMSIEKETFVETVKSKITENPGKRILIVIDTVKNAQCVYEHLVRDTDFQESGSLRRENFMLLHSRYIGRDRDKKVGALLEGSKGEGKIKVLVTTQIVEASIDIDFDILITEIAPLDSIIQRMGRVNRNRGEYIPGVGDVYVIGGYMRGTTSVYEKTVLQLTGQMLAEKYITGKTVSEKEKEELLFRYFNEDDYKEIKDRFEKNLFALDNLVLATSKTEAQKIFREVSTIDIIPFEVWGEFKEQLDQVWKRYPGKPEAGRRNEKRGFKIEVTRLLMEYTVAIRYRDNELKFLVELGTHLAGDKAIKELNREMDLRRFLRGYWVIPGNRRWEYTGELGLKERAQEEKVGDRGNGGKFRDE